MFLFTFLILLTIFIYIYITKNNGYWRKMGVPFEKPAFIFGSFREVVLGKKHFGVMYMELYKKFKNYPYFGYFKLREPCIIINDPELIKNILIKDFDHFATNDFQINTDIDLIWSKNAFIQTGDLWKKIRRAWSHSMTTSKIKAMYDIIDNKCDVMVEYLKNYAKNSPNVSLEPRQVCSKLFTDVIVGSVFGLDVDSFNSSDNPFYKITKMLFASSFWSGIVLNTIIAAPWLGRVLKLRYIDKRVENEAMKIAKNMLDERNDKGFHKGIPLDNIVLNSDYKDGVTKFDVATILFSFLLDGTETSSGVAGYAIYALATNPDVQAKLRREIDEAAAENNGKLNYEIVHKLPYLEMVFSETLRMYPAALSLQRLCTKEYELPPIKSGDDPVKVPVGMTVVVSVSGLHSDPEYYPEPEKFIPERFSENAIKTIPKYAYLPFGDGPRMCLGSRLAINQTKITLASLVRNFEIRQSPNTIGKPLVVDPTVLVMRNLDGLWVTFHDRRKLN